MGGIPSPTRVCPKLYRGRSLMSTTSWKALGHGNVVAQPPLRLSANLQRLQLHVANVGDSSALVIDSNFQGHRISLVHRPTDKKEQLRVEAEGGHVARGRVNGQLAVSRALGDHYLKTSGVTGLPSVATRD